MNDAPTQYSLLHYARGLAALAVVLHHRGVHPKFPDLLNSISEYGHVGVSVFFVISGFVIYQAAERHFSGGYRGAWRFAWKRAKRIYPAFWMSLLLCLLVSISPLMGYDLIPESTYHWTLYPPPFTAADILSTATLTYNIPPFHFGPPNVVYWTLVVEQQFYIFIFLLILPFFKGARPWIIVGSSVVALAHGLNLLGIRTLSFYVLPRHWMEFLLGILAYFIIARRVPRWVTTPIFAALVILGLLDTWSEGSLNYQRSVAASLFALLVLLAFPLNKWMTGAKIFYPLRFLGTISYSLYLVHLAAFSINDTLFAGILRVGSLSAYFTGVLMALALATIFYWLFERPFISPRRRARPAISERSDDQGAYGAIVSTASANNTVS